MPAPSARARVRLEWGPVGAAALLRELDPAGALAVVVDVLSFTTTLTVAADRGVVVHPHPWHEDAHERARALGATLAVGRRAAGPGEVSLSPRTVRDAVGLERLVLPSPNGASIAHALAATGATVLAASLRNRAAVAAHLRARLAADERAVVVLVAAGERWPDGSLRPAVEDLWGAGGVAAGLEEATLDEESRAARASYAVVAPRIGDALLACTSGRELVDGGFDGDVLVAAELDASRVVPVLGADGAFRPAH
ncbi:2-phosphosulfolactate phosphatase [Lapillicoccus jejuensis]|uniref:Probable 2-phosphosulfolactate phosphatase n=1 Tax=Lapillicoccus jejuensis TaxID=402171 RepID=A0A542E051_9MICO|nr:2-phosphosulfolactate phosphatase [Lapillicoccus jejuensis]TQJ08715.1 2-phosphosulfolactate phosphatase [Lapillicoccus jejuensis]